jgi:murein L,D-transpeptidase YcbB/YkuD
LKKGMSDARVTALRHRLAQEGDLPGTARESQRFDQELEQAVMRFQSRHTLASDGEVGRATLKALNVPLEDRIDQIRVNLERSRWVLSNLGDRYVWWYRRVSRILLKDESIVGPPGRSREPIAITRLESARRSARVNPTWTSPPDLNNEVIPP